MSELVEADFCARDALDVACDLIGMQLWRDDVGLMITEVEAYRWPDDSASHCRMGRTGRNQAMWGPPTRAYVYLCYGLHQMLNIVTNTDGEGAAVLIRSCEPISGLSKIRRRRGGKQGPVLLTGPGKVGAALGLDAQWNHHPLLSRVAWNFTGGPMSRSYWWGRGSVSTMQRPSINVHRGGSRLRTTVG